MDALELDVVLSEVTLMHMRAKLYWRYLKRRLDAADAKMNEQVCFPSFCVVQVVNAGI